MHEIANADLLRIAADVRQVSDHLILDALPSAPAKRRAKRVVGRSNHRRRTTQRAPSGAVTTFPRPTTRSV